MMRPSSPSAEPRSTQCCAQLRSTKHVQCSLDRRLQALTCTRHKNLEQFVRSQLSPKQLKRVHNGVKWMAPRRHEHDFIIDYIESDDSYEDDEDEEDEVEVEDSDGSLQTSIDDEEVAGLADDFARIKLVSRSSTRPTPESLRAARDAIVSKAAGGSNKKNSTTEYMMSGALPDSPTPPPPPASTPRAVWFEIPPFSSRPGPAGGSNKKNSTTEYMMSGALPASPTAPPPPPASTPRAVRFEIPPFSSRPGPVSSPTSPRSLLSPAETVHPGLMSLQSSPRSLLSPTETVHQGLMSLESSPRRQQSPPQMHFPLASPSATTPKTPSMASPPLPRPLAPPLQMPSPPSTVDADSERRARRARHALPRDTPVVSFHLPHARLSRG